MISGKGNSAVSFSITLFPCFTPPPILKIPLYAVKDVLQLSDWTNKVFDLIPGQFICGNKHCDEKEGLSSYEASVNFSCDSLSLVS